jgi:hypothetical protein
MFYSFPLSGPRRAKVQRFVGFYMDRDPAEEMSVLVVTPTGNPTSIKMCKLSRECNTIGVVLILSRVYFTYQGMRSLFVRYFP